MRDQKLTVFRNVQTRKDEVDDVYTFKAKVDDHELTEYDMRDIFNHDSFKTQTFQIDHKRNQLYSLNKGDVWNKFNFARPNQHYTVYYRVQSDGTIVAIKTYSFTRDSLEKYFVDVNEYKNIKNTYDLRGLKINCHAGVEVFNNRTCQLDGKKVVYGVRISCPGFDKKILQDWVKIKFGGKLKLKSLDSVADNSGFHSYSSRDSLTQYCIILEMNNPVNTVISLSDLETLMGEEMTLLQKNNFIYFVDANLNKDFRKEPDVVVLQLDANGIIANVNTTKGVYFQEKTVKTLGFDISYLSDLLGYKLEK